MSKLVLLCLVAAILLAVMPCLKANVSEEETSTEVEKTGRTILWGKQGYQYPTRTRYVRRDDDDDDDDSHDDDDDDSHDDDDHDDDDGSDDDEGSERDRSRYNPYHHRRRYHPYYRRGQDKGSPSPRSDNSRSYTHLRGILCVLVIGTGEECLVKIYQKGMSYSEQFGDESTSTSGFIDLYGRGECEEGATGIAYGYVRASVVAEAKRRGDVCESRVLTEVAVRTYDPDPTDGVNVSAGGVAGAEALAVCE